MFNNLYLFFKNSGTSLAAIIPIFIIILGLIPLTILITFLIWIHNISKNVYEIHDMFFELVKEKREKEKKEAEKPTVSVPSSIEDQTIKKVNNFNKDIYIEDNIKKS